MTPPTDVGPLLDEALFQTVGTPKFNVLKTEHFRKEISRVELMDDCCELYFKDGSGVRIKDDAQSCCEHRYVTCDDDPGSLVGNELLAIVMKAGPEDGGADSYNVRETMFVEITTTGGFITLTTHNDHNGYYGGFSISMTAL